MFLMMAISLYTSRVILQTLGIEDFGIYNAVGGIVSMFGIVSNSMSAAISRFITFELGAGNIKRLKEIFSTSVIIQISIVAIIILLAETLGTWFLNTHMVISDDRIVAANWVFQFSIMTFSINLISVPYNALIIAHERMTAFAYISILEAACKLGVAFLILISPIDHLIFYSALLMLSSVIIRITYGAYCNYKFPESKLIFHFDKSITKAMYGFAGWNFIGATSSILRDHGGNILLNIFFGPVANAARGIAMQVNAAITSFVQNFTTAINPQITKSYASGDRVHMMNLLFKGARFSFYLLMLIALPVMVNTDYILSLWLHNVPNYTNIFVKLIIVYSLNECISTPLITGMLATGRIRNYQLIVGGLQMLNIPVSYILLKLNFPPESVFIVAIVVSFMCLIARLIMLNRMIQLPVCKFLKIVYVNALFVVTVAAIIPLALTFYLPDSFGSFILQCVVCIICSSFSVLYIGCNGVERQFVFSKVSQLLRINRS